MLVYLRLERSSLGYSLVLPQGGRKHLALRAQSTCKVC